MSKKTKKPLKLPKWLEYLNQRYAKFIKTKSSKSRSKSKVPKPPTKLPSSEYKDNNRARAVKAVPFLISGTGGEKNILSAINVDTAVIVKFRHKYQVKKDVIKQAGGLGLLVNDDHWIDIFDYLEASEITKSINQKIKKHKAKVNVIDWE